MMLNGYASPFKLDAPLWLVGFQQLWLGSENLGSGHATLTTLSPSWIAETLIASYSIWTTSNLPFASPWRQNDYKLAFLDTAVSREPDGRLTTNVYRKHTYTDQYLVYDSHHPQSVKRGIVKCLYESAKRLIAKPSVISKEKKHPSSVLVSNGYALSFL